MPVFDYEIYHQLDELKKLYGSNMSNSFIRSALISLDLPYEIRNGIEGITDKLDFYKHQGYRFEELYNGIYGMALFIYRARVEVVPSLKNSRALANVSDSEKILASMAADNLKAKGFRVEEFESPTECLAQLLTKRVIAIVELGSWVDIEIIGVRFRVSGVRGKNTEGRKQRTEI